jgi:prepilin-type N-terminal cleavage/methylation domain-containing protein
MPRGKLPRRDFPRGSVALTIFSCINDECKFYKLPWWRLAWLQMAGLCLLLAVKSEQADARSCMFIGSHMFFHFSTHPLNDLKRCRPSWRMRRGFTLPEMLVVIAIIAILGFILFSAAQNMKASGKTAKATANLRQIGVLMASYTADNNNCLPILLNWGGTWFPPWQYRLMEKAGIEADWNSTLYLASCFYDPLVKDPEQHPYGGFGGNDAIIIGLGGFPHKNCLSVFGQDRGTPVSRIGSPNQKVVVASAADAQGSRFKSSWYFHGEEWVAAGSGYTSCRPYPRYNGKTLCLFVDGHTEQLDTNKMDYAARRKYFLRD